MGCFSVYCTISGISISGGQEAVLLPLIKGREYYYREYDVALPPFFGKYNDYDSIEDLEGNKIYDDLLLKYFKCNSQEFCDNLVSYHRREPEDIKGEVSLYEKLRYCWIDRQVWNFLSSTNLDPSLSIGYPKLLEYLGFELKEDKGYSERYNLKYVKDGKSIFSDGKYLKGQIYHIDNPPYKTEKTLANLFNLDQDKVAKLIGKNAFELDFVFSKKELLNLGLFTTFGLDRELVSNTLSAKSILDVYKLSSFEVDEEQLETLGLNKDLIESMKRISEDCYNITREYTDQNSILLLEDLILNHFEHFYPTLVSIKKLFNNLMVGTYFIKPYVSCRAPQGGEYRLNQIILEKFSEINKTYIYEEEDE